MDNYRYKIKCILSIKTPLRNVDWERGWLTISLDILCVLEARFNKQQISQQIKINQLTHTWYRINCLKQREGGELWAENNMMHLHVSGWIYICRWIQTCVVISVHSKSDTLISSTEKAIIWIIYPCRWHSGVNEARSDNNSS